ncbi:hypothetical protein TWF696_000299 [Orbilia brochopaga]|uniref:Uncharacterized protein n=1 Tax=Orbilia brochopaga TaxID=3140254 RepID=A0AAV9VDK1_9PEZI
MRFYATAEKQARNVVRSSNKRADSLPNSSRPKIRWTTRITASTTRCEGNTNSLKFESHKTPQRQSTQDARNTVSGQTDSPVVQADG